MTVRSVKSALSIRALVKNFGSRRALDGLDLTLRRGESLTLFGPNGAGKTTLVRIVASLSHPTSGSIEVLGRKPREAGAALRQSLGVVSHESFLYGPLSARQNLLFHAGLFNVPDPEWRVRQLLFEFGLEHRQDEPVRTFSRGLRQRCAIARALLHEPQLLILDEPFATLDPLAADRLVLLLRRHQDSTRSLLITSHDLERGLELADRVAILRSGRLVFEASRADVDELTFKEDYRRFIGGGPS